MIRKDQFHIKRPMFVDTKVHSLDKPVQPEFETGLTGFHDRSDRLWNRFNQFFLRKTLSRLGWPKIIMQPMLVFGEKFLLIIYIVLAV